MISEAKAISTRDNLNLHCEMIENGSPVWIIVTHGLGEHCARHSHFFKVFSQYFNVCLYDLRGHGKSEGQRANIGSFQEYIDDLGEVIAYLKKEYGLKRHYLFGHSMGGLITASYMQQLGLRQASDSQGEIYPEKVFLSSPAVAASGLLGEFFKFAPVKFNRGLAGIPLSVKLKGVLDIKKLSHDPRVYQNYIKDPLNSLKIHSHLFLEILAQSREVFSKPLRVDCELYVAIGSEDVLVNAPACIDYFTKVEKQAKLKVIEGAYHEMHNEIERYQGPYMKFLEDSFMGSDEA